MLFFTSCEKTLVNTNDFEVSFITDSTFKLEISLDAPGTLNLFITPFYKKHIEAIKIIGRINGNDFQTIRDIYEFQEAIFGKSIFTDVDLSDCKVLAGGRYVYPRETYENIGGDLVLHIDSIVVQPSKDNAIPSYAFAGLWLKTIAIPNSITSIGNYAFEGCEIRAFSIPNAVVEIGKGAFNRVYIQSPIEVPEGVILLPDSVFYEASQMSSIALPSTLQTMGRYCFYNCLHLNEIVVKTPIPPSCDETLWNNWYNGMRTIYVPANAIDVYKTHPIWGKADKIKPLDN